MTIIKVAIAKATKTSIRLKPFCVRRDRGDSMDNGDRPRNCAYFDIYGQ